MTLSVTVLIDKIDARITVYPILIPSITRYQVAYKELTLKLPVHLRVPTGIPTVWPLIHVSDGEHPGIQQGRK